MAKVFGNSGSPDHSPRSVAFDLGLHFYPFRGLQTKMGLEVLLGVQPLKYTAKHIVVSFILCF